MLHASPNKIAVERLKEIAGGSWVYSPDNAEFAMVRPSMGEAKCAVAALENAKLAYQAKIGVAPASVSLPASEVDAIIAIDRAAQRSL